MNTRQIIEALKCRIKSGVMMLGASSTVRARAFGDGPDRAAVSTLKQVRAFGERVREHNTRLTSFDLLQSREREVRWESELAEIFQEELHGGSK